MVLFPFTDKKTEVPFFGLRPHILHVVLEYQRRQSDIRGFFGPGEIRLGAYMVGFKVTKSLGCSGLPEGLC